MKRLHAQTVAQLKELCALHGLRKTGVKLELVERLLVALCTWTADRRRELSPPPHHAISINMA